MVKISPLSYKVIVNYCSRKACPFIINVILITTVFSCLMWLFSKNHSQHIVSNLFWLCLVKILKMPSQDVLPETWRLGNISMTLFFQRSHKQDLSFVDVKTSCTQQLKSFHGMCLIIKLQGLIRELKCRFRNDTAPYLLMYIHKNIQ